MDGIKFINSKDIQNYLREIDYKLSSEQILFLVMTNHFLNVDERAAALRELSETAPNDEIESFSKPFLLVLEKMTIKEYIDDYLQLLNSYIEILKKEDKSFCYQLYGLSETHKYELIGTYQKYESCLVRIKKEARKYKYFRLNKIGFEDIFDSEYLKKNHIMLPFAIAYIDNTQSLLYCYANSEEGGMNHFFIDSLFVSIPMPFEKGDIVKFTSSPWIEKTDKDKISEFSVFHSYFPTEDSLHKNPRTDWSDMHYCGYRPKKHGFKLNYYDFFCFDLEYADSADLKGRNKRLKGLSDVLKDKCEKEH